MGSYTYTRFEYRTPPELKGAVARRHPVVIVGAGPVGLTCAIDLATRGVPTVVLDDNDVVSVGSRAICWAKRTLEIWDRLGVGQRMVDAGVTWQLGRVFHGAREIYSFNLLPESGHKRPAFINLQQYYVEQFLVERAAEFPALIDLRWKNEVTDLSQEGTGVVLDIATPDGPYRLEADWVIAADGARSPTRTRMGLSFEGQSFEERFLIADIRMQADFPTERLFWFEPAFHAGQSALLHRQPDSIFRIDFQLGPEADPDLERRPERVMPRVRAVVGQDVDVELEWCSVYSFRCARLERFVHGRVVFAGDSAHVVSPFGARGGNGGIQDADNLCWKLAHVVAGTAPASLLRTYDEERGHGANENIRNSSRTTNFMTPKSHVERLFRDGVLALAAEAPFARSLLNAGRLSRPCSLAGMTLQVAEQDPAPEGLRPGDPCADAPVTDAAGRAGWLLDHLGGPFTVLTFAMNGEAPSDVSALTGTGSEARIVVVTAERPAAPLGMDVLIDAEGLVASRYAGRPGTTYLIRPDAHVAARFSEWSPSAVRDAISQATGRLDPQAREAA